MTATVLAVSPLGTGAITVSGPSSTHTCGDNLSVAATVLDANGNPIALQLVVWSFTSSPSSADKINSAPTTTNASGVATTTVTLDNVPGNRTVTATADGMSADAVITCVGAVLGITAPGPITAPGAVLGTTAPGLPNTSTTPDGSPVGNLSIATVLALLAVLAGGGIMVRRFAFGPR
jgi:hypothetical protein